MKIVEISDFKKIEQFLSANFSAPTHWPDWNIIVSKHYNSRFYYYGAYEDNQLIGICPVHEERNGLLKSINSGHFHYIPNGGWIFCKPVEFNFSEIKCSLRKSFTIYSLPHLKEFDVNYVGQGANSRESLIIDLDQTIDSIWLNEITGKRRNMIRKAESNNVQISRYDNTDLGVFYKLYCAANNNYKIGVHSFSFFKDLFGTAININFTILAAYLKDEVIGSMVTVNDKNYSIYWLGISVKDVVNFGQGELLQWEAIKQMKALGCKYYDLCYIDKDKLPHIHKFKSGFSDNEVSISVYKKKSLPYGIINRIQKVLK